MCSATRCQNGNLASSQLRHNELAQVAASGLNNLVPDGHSGRTGFGGITGSRF
jgi:hypothetical protein